MTNGDDQAFLEEGPYSKGLTKREEFTKAAMVGILSNRSLIDSLGGNDPKWIGEHAVRVAEATIAALNGEVSTLAVPDGEFPF